MDWQLGNVLPKVDSARDQIYEVWLDDGSVRKVRRPEMMCGRVLHFADCSHPAQNAYLSPHHVMAWKLASDGV